MSSLPLLEKGDLNHVYQRWEAHFTDIQLKHYFKFLRDDLVTQITGLLDQGKTPLVWGPFRSGKTSLAMYLGKRLELEGRNVTYLDPVDEDISEEDSFLAKYDQTDLERRASQCNILLLDELYYGAESSWPIFMALAQQAQRKNKGLVIFMHSNYFYEDPWHSKSERKDQLFSLQSIENIYLFSYSSEQEKEILGALGADPQQTQWCLENLQSNRQIYNRVMHTVFDKGQDLADVLSEFDTKGTWFGKYYWLQDNARNKELVNDYMQGRRLTKDELDRLVFFGIASRKQDKHGNIKDHIPTPFIRHVEIWSKEHA
jgi:hypothetical protein